MTFRSEQPVRESTNASAASPDTMDIHLSKAPSHTGKAGLSPMGQVDSGSFDLVSEAEHPSEESCEHISPESYHLLVPHGSRTPPCQTSFSGQLAASSHPANSLLFNSFALSQGQQQQQQQHRREWVVDHGVACDQGIRSSMEDEHVTLVEPDVAFFGVYDGHGGRQCATYIHDHLHSLVLQHTAVKTAARIAIAEAFAQVEHDFLSLSEEEQNAAGCVCAVALVQGDTLTVGNVGDCEVILGRGEEPVVLTVKHNPSSNCAEAARVTEAGGCIVNRRVGHPRLNPRVCSLAVSRAVGDAGFKLDEYTLGKPSGLIADADTCEVQLAPEDAFLLMACDGLWDTMTYTEAVTMCTQLMESGADANSIADKLVSEALMRGTRDNITAIFVRLKPATAAAVA